jgi:serine/threonine-protein kinase
MDLDEMIGTSLGNYRVTSKLGQGGMGAVYLAEHPVLGRKAAIKVLLPELSQHEEAVKRFFHEARTTARLRHPAMVDVFDFGSLPDGRAFLIMDFLEGECLEDRIANRGAMPVADALGIARQIALGVSVAHGEQIVHRDLKPDNIFLLPPVPGSRDERVKILDFGIAKLARPAGGTSMTMVGVVLGTPLYMSPEQCRGDAEVDHRADVYSLGCILFAMLGGRPPFISESMLELMALHQHAKPPRLSDVGVTVDPAVEQIVAIMLAKAPVQRFSSMLAVADALDQLLVHEKASASGPHRAGPPTEAAPPPVEQPAAPYVYRTRTPMERPTQAAAQGPADSISPTTVTPFLPRRNTPVGAVRRAAAIRRTSNILIIVAGVVAGVAVALVALRLRGRPPAAETAATVQSAAAPAPAAAVPSPREVPPAPEPIKPSPPPAAPPAAVVAPPVPPPDPGARAVKGTRRPRVTARPESPAPAGAPRETPPAAPSPAPSALEREIEERPRAKPDAPAKGSRPIYKGTQLDIEKKVPY